MHVYMISRVNKSINIKWYVRCEVPGKSQGKIFPHKEGGRGKQCVGPRGTSTVILMMMTTITTTVQSRKFTMALDVMVVGGTILD